MTDKIQEIESEITTIQLHRSTKNKLNRFKKFLSTDFNKIVDSLMDLVYKFKMKQELKNIVEEKKVKKNG